MKAHAISLKAPQPCNYCGIGEYKVVLSDLDNDQSSRQHLRDSTRFAFLPSPGAQVLGQAGMARKEAFWLIFACNHCGNVQIFRPDQTKDPDIWRK